MGLQFSGSLTANGVVAARSNGRHASYGARSGIWRDLVAGPCGWK
ncbi:hypothetical protein CPAR01_03092 [Colletotrichum paranaense]|uniref:Uncharacterized protein n=4 Tax=Colletotrichum acutatum species complex TaxID=2707335 RepID=A0AAJ0DV63_9PEZI|nr:uncharacterized protein CCOS01_13873 [Colletotrichum costaricense]XP_060354707.1 uncharacterized protein CPAR01_03092 [Colletotrichum paranaense]XP_060389204.1 uncharacterized protein CTAM01_00527 [Colletotrichum tamarilloi]KAI3544065.1 hypothetical protein CSPX01_05820 [Colletotrichum filicis]KAK1451862.1 hypothetical protein CMEL01_06436 [Colletotrichum melonis]KAK1513131.1 hypothetical protein CTAM01_00527 [Colletotrichum tamarilloi]KAK1514592.1 hypothetical protein CCOS01_13873 [Collet